MKHKLIAWVHTIVAFLIFLNAFNEKDFYWSWVAVWFAFTTAWFAWMVVIHTSNNMRNNHEKT